MSKQDVIDFQKEGIDEAISKADKLKAVMAYCERELAPEDLRAIRAILGQQGQATDEPPPFPGRPRPGGAMDGLPLTLRRKVLTAQGTVHEKQQAGFEQRNPGSTRITISK